MESFLESTGKASVPDRRFHPALLGAYASRHLRAESPGLVDPWVARAEQLARVHASALPDEDLAPIDFFEMLDLDSLWAFWRKIPAAQGGALGDYLARLSGLPAATLGSKAPSDMSARENHGFVSMQIHRAMLALRGHFEQCDEAGVPPGSPLEWATDAEQSRAWILAMSQARDLGAATPLAPPENAATRL